MPMLYKTEQYLVDKSSVSRGNIFEFTNLCEEYSWLGWGGSVSLTNGGIVSCIWTLARWTGPAKVYSRPDLFGFQIADFKITCIAFQQKYVGANTFVLRWNIVMKIIWRENLFPNTAKLLVSVQQTYGIIWEFFQIVDPPIHFYRTQVNLGSDLWVRMSVTHYKRLCKT